MAENENRPAGDSKSPRRRAERQRGEPRVIEGSAIPLPSGTEPEAGAEAATPAEPPNGETGRKTEIGEPVLFGSAWRDDAREAPAGPSGAVPLGSAGAAADQGVTPVGAALPAGPDSIDAEPAAPAPSGSPTATAAADALPSAGSATAMDSASAAGAAPRRRSGWLLPVVSSVLALALLGTIAWIFGNEAGRSGLGDLAATVDALQNRVASLESRPDPERALSDTAALDKRIGALDAAEAQSGKTLGALGERVEAVAKDAAAARAAAAAAAVAAPPPSSPDAKTADVATKADVTALDAKTADLEARVNDLAAKPAPPPPPPPVDLGPLDRRIADLQNRLAALRAEVAAIPAPDLQPLDTAIAAVSRRLTAAEAAFAAPKPVDPAISQRLDANAAAARAAAFASMSEQLQGKFDDGRPFAPELDALRALGADEAALEPLVPFASEGAPTAAALKTQWNDVRDRTIAAAAPRPNEGVVDRLLTGARDLVRVRRTGMPPANADAGTAAAQVDSALDRGDLGGALAAWTTLPEAPREASRSFADTVEARLRAGQAAASLATRALAALSPPKP